MFAICIPAPLSTGRTAKTLDNVSANDEVDGTPFNEMDAFNKIDEYLQSVRNTLFDMNADGQEVPDTSGNVQKTLTGCHDRMSTLVEQFSRLNSDTPVMIRNRETLGEITSLLDRVGQNA